MSSLVRACHAIVLHESNDWRKRGVLSTSVGGLAEVIGKDENLYSKDNVAKFVDRIKYLSEHRDVLDSDREYYYNRYKNNYTIEANVTGHLNLYEEIK